MQQWYIDLYSFDSLKLARHGWEITKKQQYYYNISWECLISFCYKQKKENVEIRIFLEIKIILFVWFGVTVLEQIQKIGPDLAIKKPAGSPQGMHWSGPKIG